MKAAIGRPLTILLAEDDPDDRLITEEALEENSLERDLRVVGDGEELMSYLEHRDRYADPDAAPRPDLILLDLNMPKKDGREALREIKADPRLRRIPIVILTTSRDEADMDRSCELGADLFVSKPVTFQGLVAAMGAIAEYWSEQVETPAIEHLLDDLVGLSRMTAGSEPAHEDGLDRAYGRITAILAQLSPRVEETKACPQQ